MLSRYRKKQVAYNLNGSGASVNDSEVIFGSGEQSFDIQANANHISASTEAKIVEKSILRNKSKSLFKGMIRILEEATKSNSYLSGRSILLDPDAKSDAYQVLRYSISLIKNGQADHILLTGVIASVFLRAQARIKYHLEIDREEELVRKAHALIGEYPDVFSTPVDIAIERNGKRVEIMVRELVAGDCILDMGPETVKHYEKIIFGAGTVFISGPAGFFENEQFSYGTEHLLKAVANSMATTIVSGGHLTFALKKYDLHNKINHVSTAGGALVLYLAREKLPMIAALEWAASNSY